MPLARIPRASARPSLVAGCGMLVLASAIAAQGRSASAGPPRVTSPETRAATGSGSIPTTGDSPLALRTSFSGRVDSFLQVIPHRGEFTPSAFTVTGIPPGATILQAWVVTALWEGAGQLEALTFGGVPVGARLPDAVDPDGAYHLSMYRFDVGALVMGDGSYPYALATDVQRYGECLVVIYRHASLPPRTITLHDGSESLRYSTTATTFQDQPSGPGRLQVFTQADDLDVPFGESLSFGGTVLAEGEVFSANVGPVASLLEYAVTVSAGDNELEITTSDDWFGLHLALLSVEGDGKITLDFETDDGGEVLTNGQDVQSGEEFGVLVDVDGLSAHGLSAAIFDSDAGGPNDPSQDLDLLVGLGNVLILQERPAQTVPGVYDRPNDDAGGGTLTFAFRQPVTACTLDLIDIDPGPGFSVVRLIDAAGRRRTYTVPGGWTEDLVGLGGPAFRTLDLTSLAAQPGFAAMATAVEDAGFDATGVVRIEVELAGSGALDGLSFVPASG